MCVVISMYKCVCRPITDKEQSIATLRTFCSLILSIVTHDTHDARYTPAS